MGETTFGKGLVQAQFPLTEGAALLLTIAHYYTPSGRLIQRDYSKGSFFDYYYARKPTRRTHDDVKPTDTGRKMYGGGGITPDEKFDAGKGHAVRAARAPVRRRFTVSPRRILGRRSPRCRRTGRPMHDLMARFKDYLHTNELHLHRRRIQSRQEVADRTDPRRILPARFR